MYIFIYKYIHIDGNLGRVKAPNELKHWNSETKRGNNILQYINLEYCAFGRLMKLWFWAKENAAFIYWKSDFRLRKVKEREMHEKRAVMAARVLGKFCWLPQEGKTSASAAPGALNRGLRPEVRVVSARLSVAKCEESSGLQVLCDRDFEP